MNLSNSVFYFLNRLKDAGATVEGDKVTFSVDELAKVLSEHNISTINTFVRLQRMAGIQTVRFADVKYGNVNLMVDRMLDSSLIVENHKPAAEEMLREGVIDILPLVDDRIRWVCNGDAPLSYLGFHETPSL